MRRLRNLPRRRVYAVIAAVAALAVTGGIAQAALSGSDERPAPKPLDRAVYDATRAPAVDGISARIEFTNGLLPAGSLPNGAASPLAAGAEGRLWMTGDGRFRLELQSDGGDAQIVSDGERISVYDASTNTIYRSAFKLHDRGHGDEPTLGDIRKGLDALAQTWTLSGAQPTNTAGRPSYTLRLAPKDDGGLLGAAEIAWDAVNGVPLRGAVYAQGQSQPVLELEVTDISFGKVSNATVSTRPAAGARVIEIDPMLSGTDAHAARARGVEAVQRRLDFPLAAPRELAGLPRRDVRLIRSDEGLGAVTTYGEGMGAILVLQQKTGHDPLRSQVAQQLPKVNIDGGTGTELGTALGTVVWFDRDGVSYTVAGSVPPVAAENAARGLR
jgi:outer membrane lipoprotein-sorting protein